MCVKGRLMCVIGGLMCVSEGPLIRYDLTEVVFGGKDAEGDGVNHHIQIFDIVLIPVNSRMDHTNSTV